MNVELNEASKDDGISPGWSLDDDAGSPNICLRCCGAPWPWECWIKDTQTGGFTVCGCCGPVEAKNPGDREFLSAVRALVVSSVRIAFTLGSMVFVFQVVGGITLYNVLHAIGHCDDSECQNAVGAGVRQFLEDHGVDMADIAFQIVFNYVSFLALFMLLPAACCPFWIVPICGLFAAKHQDRGLLKFVVCQHATGAVGATSIILYRLYRLISGPGANVSSEDVKNAGDGAQAAGDAMSQDNEAASTARWWVFLICFEIFATVLILVLHWVAFGAGLKAVKALPKVTAQPPQVPMVPIQPRPDVQSPTDQDKYLVSQE